MNSKTVWIVQADRRKDLSDAQRYGELREVFSSVPRTYNTPAMLAHARRVLVQWEHGDHLMMIGDPTLCAVCAVVIAEQHPVVDVLRWDRNLFQYVPQRWDFADFAAPHDHPTAA